MVEDDLSGTAGRGLAADSGRDMLNFSSSLEKSGDVFLQIFTGTDGCFFFRFTRHNCYVSIV